MVTLHPIIMKTLDSNVAIRANTYEEYKTLMSFFRANGATTKDNSEETYNKLLKGYLRKFAHLVFCCDGSEQTKYNSLADYFDGKEVKPEVPRYWANSNGVIFLRCGDGRMVNIKTGDISDIRYMPEWLYGSEEYRPIKLTFNTIG